MRKMAVKKKLVGKSVDANPRPSKLVKIISLFLYAAV
jgi:hypothetical protein